jgi:ATP-binding cassette subfamily B protein
LNELAVESKKKSMNLAKIQALFGPLMIALIGISNLVVIYFGGQMYINGTIKSIGTIAEFILYVNMLTWPVASLGWISSMVQEAEASQKRINEFLKIEPDIQNKNLEKSNIEGAISFKNVSFTYSDTNIRALENVSFSVNKGETLAILGKTGSGKSTIIALISRLYEVTEGKITIDHKEISTQNLYDLRNSIGIVPQDALLFSDTIKNNIKFGKENANQEEVEKAAISAMVHDNIINFNKQYDTVLGERGITLSGGQKQRLSIARAVLKNPPIMILDEATSALDTESEKFVQVALENMMQNRTSIVIAHRLSTIQKADLIVVMQKGEIVEQGSHEDLLSKNGMYAKLVNMQSFE